MINHYIVAYHYSLTKLKILKVHKIVSLQSDSCYSLEKTGDFLWECPLGEEEGIKHDEQILKRDVFITAVLQLKRKHCALIASFQQQDVFLLSITNILYLYSV